MHAWRDPSQRSLFLVKSRRCMNVTGPVLIKGKTHIFNNKPASHRGLQWWRLWFSPHKFSLAEPRDREWQSASFQGICSTCEDEPETRGLLLEPSWSETQFGPKCRINTFLRQVCGNFEFRISSLRELYMPSWGLVGFRHQVDSIVRYVWGWGQMPFTNSVGISNVVS